MTSTSVDRLSGARSSLAFKAPCRVASTVNIATLNGLLTVDGVVLVADDRVLVKNQTSGVDNGVYLADSGDWALAPDCNGANDLATGTIVYVNEGTQSGFWYVTTANPITVGTTSITFAQASSVLAAFSVFIQTLLDDANAAAARTTLDAMEDVLTTIGDTVVATTAGAAARLAAAATVAAHATTMNPWVAREIIASGGAVTFTDIADAPYVGAITSIYMNAAHIWTDGAVFNVQGNTTYTAVIGDWVDLVARSAVSAFDLFIRRADGTAAAGGSAASTTAAGIVELLTQAEYSAGADTTRAPTANLTRITLATEQNISGTSVDFTGIPAGTQRITIMGIGVSTSGTSPIIVQLGDSGGVETSTYVGGVQVTGNAGTPSANSAGFLLADAMTAALTYQFTVVLDLERASTFRWMSQSISIDNGATTQTRIGNGSKALSAALDRVRITTAGGANTFDAGSINISYER